MKEFAGYKKGINLGGWFSQCCHSEKHYDSFIKRDDFKRIKSWELDHVRVPVDYNLVQNPDFSFREQGFSRIEKTIVWCRENSLNMILDLHKTIGFSFDKGENENGFFEDEKYRINFCNLWEEFALRFGKYGNVAFELLNEITDKEYSPLWNKTVERAIETIRQYAPDKKIIVGSYWHNSIMSVADLDVPYDENIVYGFHCYNPIIFTHQGAYWIDGMDRTFRMGFDDSTDKYIEFQDKYIKNEHPDSFKPGSHIDEDYFDSLFQYAVKPAQERNAALYCGEYGVIDNADPQQALKWLKCIHPVFVKYGIGRALWSYKEMDFGLTDAHYDDVRSEMIEYM